MKEGKNKVSVGVSDEMNQLSRQRMTVEMYKRIAKDLHNACINLHDSMLEKEVYLFV